MTGPLIVTTPDDLRALVGAELDRRLSPLLEALAAVRPVPRDSEKRPDGLLTRREVAGRLGIHPRSLRRLILENQFPAGVRVGAGGRAVRWRASDVDDFVEGRRLPL